MGFNERKTRRGEREWRDTSWKHDNPEYSAAEEANQFKDTDISEVIFLC